MIAMKPPWDEYPHFERSDLGWRMGVGEDYLAKFEKWFSGQTPDERTDFAAAHAEPESWSGYYTGFGVPMGSPWSQNLLDDIPRLAAAPHARSNEPLRFSQSGT
jgi:hypothetical protein